MRYQCVGAAVAAIVLAAGAARAAVIDVDNLLAPATPPTMGASGFGASSIITPSFTGGGTASQTWTVGVTGQLAEVDLYDTAGGYESLDGVNFINAPFGPAFDVTLSVLGGGSVLTPGTDLLASVTKSSTDIGTQFAQTAFDFTGLGVVAHAGDVLTFQMSVAACPANAVACNFGWENWDFLNGVGNTYGYAGGAAFTDTQSGHHFTWANQDLNFRTWMNAAPEPDAWSLMLAGFVLMGIVVRRRTAATA